MDLVDLKKEKTPELSEDTHKKIKSVTTDVKNLLETENTEIDLDKIKYNEDIDYI